MALARRTLLEILGRQPHKQMDLTELSRELDRRRVLGFGVEARHVVYALKRENKVRYDRVREIVYLV